MKKSKFIALALITSALASCHKERPKHHRKVFMRSDQTADYSQANYGNSNGMGNALLWYYCFRPYGYYGNNGVYTRAGYYSHSISEHSNIGHSSAKSGIVRGGFDGRGFSVSS